jgi:hypothetical protein
VVHRFWKAVPDVRPSTPADSLDAFGAEASTPPGAPPSPSRHPSKPSRSVVVVATLLVSLLGAAAAAGAYYWFRIRPATAFGTLKVETVPAGLEVFVDGSRSGVSPLTLSLPAGPHDLRIGREPDWRTAKVSLGRGSTVVQHFELAAAAPVAASTLRIQSDPAKLPVSIDGVGRGTSPVEVQGIAPGDHEVVVGAGATASRRKVTVAAGETLSLLVSAGNGAPAAEPVLAGGWLAVSAPVALQISEGGKVIGTTAVDRLMLPAGEHQLDVGDAALGFQVRRPVRIVPGKTASLAIAIPNGTLSLNALPWAEVFVDGERIGETPIGNLVRPIGRHEVIFRHPQLGERHESVVVAAGRTTRLGVDLSRK